MSTTSTAPRFCPACGTAQDPTARFCPDCGNAHTVAAPVLPAPPSWPRQAAAAPPAPAPAPAPQDDPDALDTQFRVGVLRDALAVVLVFLFVLAEVVMRAGVGWAVLVSAPALAGILAPYAGRPAGLHRKATALRAVRIILLLPLMVVALIPMVKGIGAGSQTHVPDTWPAVAAAALGATSADRVRGPGRTWWTTWSALCLGLAVPFTLVGLVQGVSDQNSFDVWGSAADTVIASAMVVLGVGALIGSVRCWGAALVLTAMAALAGPLAYTQGFMLGAHLLTLLGLAFGTALPVLRGRRPTGMRAGDRARAVQAGMVAGAVALFITGIPESFLSTFSYQRPPGAGLEAVVIILGVLTAPAAAVAWAMIPAVGRVAVLAWATVFGLLCAVLLTRASSNDWGHALFWSGQTVAVGGLALAACTAVGAVLAGRGTRPA